MSGKNSQGSKSNDGSKDNTNKAGVGNSLKRFNEVHSKNIAAAKKVVQDYVSSSEDEEDVDVEIIIDKMYQHYKPSTIDPQLLNKTASILENVLHAGAATCVICIRSVRRADAIWSCRHCHCIFHFNCIKRWANDSLAHIKEQVHMQQNDQGYYNNLGEYVPPKKVRNIHWCCPQCRSEYDVSDRPTNYVCFCGKDLNPQPQPFLIPHSCGEICGKLLKPECGHKCVLLCHPGPCPPCGQYANVSCRCRKSQPKTIRCIQKKWQCTEKCNQLLPCGQHCCTEVCHEPGACPPCSSTSMQSCQCGHQVAKRKCAELSWHCPKVCGLPYPCGIHFCKKVCHSGACGDCPLGTPRSCPCGKTKKEGPCREVADPCGDTCQKTLPCGSHKCTQRCHRGDCNECLVIVEKQCRCGMHVKDLPCNKEFCCNTKCRLKRNCGKHLCNRKCCDGQCPPCDKVCGKPLSCQKHKCQSICHEGPCYPCQQTTQVNCACGKTSKNLPCGRVRTARIVCVELCRIPSKCHHPNKHRCHKKECPPCNQLCGLPNNFTGCGHVCQAKCHAAIPTPKINGNDGIWNRKSVEYKTLPHPQCTKMVPITCLGGHETAEWPCWNAKSTSCQLRCNRSLRCGNHKCQRICHEVPDNQNMMEQNGCESCELGCQLARPPGCLHPCPQPCHLPPCKPCNVSIRTKCHCGLAQIAFKCTEYYSVECPNDLILVRQEHLKSCGDRCIKNYPCGHRCLSVCHSGSCPDAELCRKKVRIYCECKRLKVEVSCDKHRGGVTEISCDKTCNEMRASEEKKKQMEAEKQRLHEDIKNRNEVEMFEKKFAKRKQKERKLLQEKPKSSVNWRKFILAAVPVVAVVLAVLVALYEN